jgi:phosphonatase-like hydrolase
MPKFQLLVCDIAGTILKDNYEVANSFSKVFDHHGIPATLQEINQLMGVHKVEAMERILELHRPEAPNSLAYEMALEFESYMIDYYQNSPDVALFEDVTETFEAIRRLGLFIGLNTGFPDSITQTILTRTKLVEHRLVDCVVSSDQVPAGRPSPWMIKQLMADVKVRDERLVVKIGDTPVDILEGRNAGCGLVLSTTTGSFTKQELIAQEPDGIIDHFNEIFTYLV